MIKYLKRLFYAFLGVEATPPLLPPPSAESLALYEEQRQRIRAVGYTLGIQIGQGPHGEAIVVPLDGSSPGNVVGLREDPPDLEMALRTGAPSVQVLNQSVPIDTSGFLDLIGHSIEDSPSGPLQDLLFATRTWFGNAGSMRRCIVSGRSDLAVGVPLGGDTVVSQTKPVAHENFGHLVRASLVRSPLNGGITPNGAHPLLDVFPERGGGPRVQYLDSHYRVQGSNEVHALFSFRPRMDALEFVLARLQQISRLDILGFLENVGDPERLFATLVLRASGDSLDQLDAMERMLNGDLGSAERLEAIDPLFGQTISRAFQAFIPGGPAPARQNRFSVREWGSFIEALVGGVNALGHQGGDLPMGKTGQHTVFFPLRETPVIVIEGPSGTGKTTLARLLAHMIAGPRVALIHTTQVRQEEPGLFAREIGGQYVNVELPNPRTVEEFNGSQESWEMAAWRSATRLRRRWESEGELVGLPYTLRRGSGDPVLYSSYSRIFLKEIVDALSWYHVKSRKLSCLIIDDVVGTGIATATTALADSARLEAGRIRDMIQELVATVRHKGIVLIITVHSREEFKHWPPGVWTSIPLAIRLKSQTGWNVGEVWYPPETRLEPAAGEVGVSGFQGQFNFHLPPDILDRLLCKR